MSIFFRGAWDDLYLRISSDEPLGVLDTAHKEDYHGEDGFLSLYHVETGQRFQIQMSEAPQYTPGIPRDNFVGTYPLVFLPDGLYQVQGRVRDELGNYTILSDFESPFGDERIIPLGFELRPGFYAPCSIRIGNLIVAGGLRLEQPFAELPALQTPISETVMLEQHIRCHMEAL